MNFKVLGKNEEFDSRDKTEKAITDEIHKHFGQSVALVLSSCSTNNDLADLKRISYTNNNDDENSEHCFVADDQVACVAIVYWKNGQ